MSDQVELTDPVDHSVGGMYGHLFRRAFHIGMSVIPLVYYEYADELSDLASITELQLVSLLTFGIAFSEAVRLKLGITIFGQRDYESKQVSALAWGGLAVGLTFLTLSEYPELVWPLILSLSLGDPFLGEVRRKGNTPRTVFISGSIFLAIIWIACWYQLGTPIWMAVFMPPLCVAAEWPRLRWIDDNATMLLIPLCAAIMLLPWL
ncbi:MAG: hypothetical protein VXY11_05715 [Candidatus Thermoplasmatota archaeon]|nr:hypothetical protein [Candidatus Thermoplasmatota archaeon]MEC8788832.1 hypothetical protein [Candidatus Thermoplasmatota archaeon]